jgi:hypothetical protein
VDKFLVLKKHAIIVDLLRDHCLNGSLSINWINFGTGNHTRYEPQPVTKRFVYRESEAEEIMKTIVCVRDFKGIRSPHWAYLQDDSGRRDTTGQWNEGKYLAGVHNPTFNTRKPTDIAILHHYRYKSLEEFNRKNCVRGDIFHGLKQCTNSTLDELSSGIVFDDCAWQFLCMHVPEYKDFRR